MPDINPNRGLDIQQLSAAVGYSRRQLRVFRDKRLELLREYVGKHYSDNGAAKKVPVNLLELAMNIYLNCLWLRLRQ